MIRGNRGEDHNFYWFHLLYYRFCAEDVAGGRLIPNRIKYDNTSVNWCKYSKPWDVIFDNPGFGMAQFLVALLPSGIPREIPAGQQSDIHVSKPKHDPLPENYAHTEIRTYDSLGNERGNKLGRLARKEFQQILSDRAIILLDSSR